MAEDQRVERGYPLRENSDTPIYPPVPDDGDRRLPPVSSITYAAPVPGYSPDSGYPDPSRFRPDPRHPSDQRGWSSVSPTEPNGHLPPVDSRYELPIVHANGSVDPSRYEERRQFDDRAWHDDQRHYEPRRERGYEDRRRFEERPQFDERSRQYDDRARFDERSRYHEPYYPQPPASGRGVYPPGPEPYYNYQRPGAYGYSDYGRGPPPPATAPQPQQAAPRQRTSIACRYCRKRKIRCSGYQNTQNGKCTNCDKLRIDCVFQPVSSNSGTAFVPLSAVPGGVPAGTPLYGAYGQPLAPASGQQQQGPPPQGQPQGQPQAAFPGSSFPPSYSPITQYQSSLSHEDREPSRRRPRPPDEGHATRLPPPTIPPNSDPRRRSPVSTQSGGTPPAGYHQYPPVAYEQDRRTPTPHRNSPGGQPSGVPPLSQTRVLTQPASHSPASSNPMSLGHLMSSGPAPDAQERAQASDMDKSMLGRLDRRPLGGAPQSTMP